MASHFIMTPPNWPISTHSGDPDIQRCLRCLASYSVAQPYLLSTKEPEWSLTREWYFLSPLIALTNLNSSSSYLFIGKRLGYQTCYSDKERNILCRFPPANSAATWLNVSDVTGCHCHCCDDLYPFYYPPTHSTQVGQGNPNNRLQTRTLS